MQFISLSSPTLTIIMSGLAQATIINHYAHMRRVPLWELHKAMVTNRALGGHACGEKQPSDNNVPHRFELFILGDGEKKVTEEIDTRKSGVMICSAWSCRLGSTYVYPNARTKPSNLLRDPIIFDLHLQQRRPHPRQCDSCSPPAIPPRPVFRLQSSTSPRSVRPFCFVHISYYP